jgi:hypothetical protein
VTVAAADAAAEPQRMIRRWVVGVVAALSFLVALAVPTDLIDTPWFTREIPPTWWSWPSVLVSAVLAGLVAATYVRAPGDGTETVRRRGVAGGLLTFFAVGCPVCNKLVLVALGSAGAMSWFAPVQPLLALAGITALTWALRTRLANRRQCALTGPSS